MRSGKNGAVSENRLFTSKSNIYFAFTNFAICRVSKICKRKHFDELKDKIKLISEYLEHLWLRM